MLKHAVATALFMALSLPVAAACVGDSYLDGLGDDQTAELTDAVSAMPYAEGLTWTATKGGDTLTIVGTMHIYDPRLEAIREKVAAAVLAADLIMLEATPEEEAKLQQLITDEPGRLFILDGPTLPELLDEATWQLVADASAQRGIPTFIAAKMRPWYLSLLLAIPPCAMGDMTAGVRGLDYMLTQDAQAANVPLQAIEPYTTLFDLFKDEPIGDQIDMLRVNMLAEDLQRQIFVAMLDLYFAEDVGRLWNMSRIAMSEIQDVGPDQAAAMFAAMQDVMLDNRNRNWIPVITQATATNDKIVVAVGAAHLIGEMGILQLLENEGWAITQIR